MTMLPIRLVVMMIRPPVAAVIFLFAALGTARGGRADDLHPLFTVVALVVAGWFVHATVLNDLGDEAIDRVNLQGARGRPLVSGDATRRQLLLLGSAAGTVALLVGWAVSWQVGVVVTAGLALNAAYSLRPVRLSDRGALASFLLPTGYVALPYLVGVLTVRPALDDKDLVLLAGLYVTFIGRIVLKDFRDVRGDTMFGKRTFLVRHGRRSTVVFSAACWIAGTSTLLLLFPWRSPLMAAMAAYLGCALGGLRLLDRDPGRIAEQVVIGAIAQAGRGMAVTLLAHLTMLEKGWPALAQALVTAMIAVVFLDLYLATLAMRDRVEAIRPY